MGCSMLYLTFLILRTSKLRALGAGTGGDMTSSLHKIIRLTAKSIDCGKRR